MSHARLLTFFIEGEPKAQPRVKAFMRGKHAGVYTPKSADAWKAQVRMAWGAREPLVGPVRLQLTFRMPRPKRLKASEVRVPHTATPDWDNLGKAVCDALTDAGAWIDDACVYCSSVVKRYADPGQPTGVMIRLRTFNS